MSSSVERIDNGKNGIPNNEETPQIDPTIPEGRSDDAINGTIINEDHPLEHLTVAASRADHADHACPVSDPAAPDTLESSLERISLDSVINCGSYVHQQLMQNSTHPVADESWATQRHDTTEAEESQPLSGDSLPSLAGSIGPPSLKKTVKVYCWQTWWLEILSSLLALGCLVAMVTILAIHQGQPLPKWPELISINSLIAIFAAVFKASLIMPVAEGLGQLKWEWFRRPHYLADIEVFDNASRGPWGSILLIVGHITQSEKALLAGLGALITILALAVDPLSQAMIQHRRCVREMENGVAQVARTNTYTQYYKDRWFGEPQASIPETMIDEVYKGLSEPQEVSTLIDFKCASGNCTFGQEGGEAYFSSLAVCHSCHDISDEIIASASPQAWTLPSGAKVGARLGGKVYSAVRAKSRSFEGNPPTVYGFDAISLYNDECLNGQCELPSPTTRAFALRCRLDACVKTYQARVSNGIYNEVEHDMPGERLRYFSRSYTGFYLVTNSTIIDGLKHPCPGGDREAPGTIKFSESVGLYDPKFSGNASIAWKYYPRECLWALDLASWLGLEGVLNELLADNATQIWGDKYLNSVKGSLWLRKIFADGQGNVSTAEEVMRGVAHSITAAMRNRPGGNETEREANPTYLKYASGKAFATETCIDVEWGWLAYPLALLVLQWIFSALVVVKEWNVRKTGEERMAWKTSPVALLFHGLDEGLREKNGDLTSLRQMDGVSERLKVQLVPGDGQKRKGWRFCES